MKRVILLNFLLFISLEVFTQSNTGQKFPESTILLIRNCSYESRTMTFTGQLNYFMFWAFGQESLEKNRTALFSHLTREDSNYLRDGMIRLRKILPRSFWKFPMNSLYYDNTPNEDSIWFIQIYAQYLTPKTIKVFAAIKIIFEGNDARIDEQRADPKIQKVEYIFDKGYLTNLEKTLFTYPAAK